ncbi:MAG: TIGR02679 domain-containing protein, partial [Cryobacterium sp.]
MTKTPGDLPRRAAGSSPRRTGPAGPVDPGDLELLRRLLGTPDLAWLLARMRTRLESTGRLSGTVTKPNATAGERAAVARLFDRSVRAGQTASVSLDALDDTLRGSGAWPQGLAAAVIALTGEVVDPQSRAAERDAWQAAADTLRRLQHPELDGWADGLIRSGALRRAAPLATDAKALALRLVAVSRALPAGGQSLGAFAAATLGDRHALDDDTTLGALAVSLAATLGAPTTLTGTSAPAPAAGAAAAADDAVPAAVDAVPAAPHAVDAPGSARWRRDAWASVGVMLDELSATVLVLGLPGGDASPTARALNALAATGQPVVLTLRQLQADALGAIPAEVFVCQSPELIAAAADQLGAHCAPVVCLNGHAGAATLQLLQALRAGGAQLRYHGDF